MYEEIEQAVKNLKSEVEKVEALVDELDQEFKNGDAAMRQADRVLSDAKKSLIQVTKEAKLDRDCK